MPFNLYALSLSTGGYPGPESNPHFIIHVYDIKYTEFASFTILISGPGKNRTCTSTIMSRAYTPVYYKSGGVVKRQNTDLQNRWRGFNSYHP